MTNPFMARTKGASTEPESGSVTLNSGDDASTTPRTDGEPSRAELKAMTVPELRKLARDRQLDDDGTKAELVDRLAD